VPFLRSFSTHTQDGFVGNGRKNFFVPANSRAVIPYKDDWNVERGITDGLDRVTWVYKAVFAIASNAARLPIVQRKGSKRNSQVVEDSAILKILNKQTNIGQDAFNFRFMLSSQVLLSKRGAFIEIIRNRVGDVTALVLLPPQFTSPIPDKDKFISGFHVNYGAGQTRIVPAEDVIWVRIPHPLDPYRGQTPLESAGLAIEYDYYARVYNRNFVINDNRPGGILVVGGEIDDEQSEEIRRRFAGTTGSNIGGAGRLTVMAADTAQYIDTSTSQRDSQYNEARLQNKDEILIAFGVPESVIGNAADRTFANADVELDVFWRETMLPHLTLLEAALNKLDDDESTYFSYDLSSVAILSRDDRDRASFHLDELKQGAISIDEYRLLTGREPVGIDELLVPTNLSPVVLQTNSSIDPNSAPNRNAPELLNPNQRPGRRPNDAPDDAVPSGNTVNRPENVNDPNPIPVNQPPMVERAQEVGETKIIDNLAEKRLRHLQRFQKSVALQSGALLKRQMRVTLEKANSKKIKEKWSEGIKTEDIFDVDVWDKQLGFDARTSMAAIVMDGAIEILEDENLITDDDYSKLNSIIDSKVDSLLAMNYAVKDQIDSILVAQSSMTHEEFVEKLKGLFEETLPRKILIIAKNESVAGFNEAMIWAAKKMGFSKKTWVCVNDGNSRSSHDQIARTTIGIDEIFMIDGKSIGFPNDPLADFDLRVNCRCTLSFS
jgi:HK97 family phage portal protein